jgi:hypothetical protein
VTTVPISFKPKRDTAKKSQIPTTHFIGKRVRRVLATMGDGATFVQRVAFGRRDRKRADQNCAKDPGSSLSHGILTTCPAASM